MDNFTTTETGLSSMMHNLSYFVGLLSRNYNSITIYLLSEGVLSHKHCFYIVYNHLKENLMKIHKCLLC
jgi:hypothetical protein